MKITYLTQRVGTKSAGEVRELDVRSESCLIGRKDAAITIDDSRCSKVHASLSLSSNGALVLTDMGSRNGTYVGEKKIKKVALNSGEAIRIGHTLITILKVSLDKSAQTAEASEIMHSWPGTWQCLPDEKRKKFEGYFGK